MQGPGDSVFLVAGDFESSLPSYQVWAWYLVGGAPVLTG